MAIVYRTMCEVLYEMRNAWDKRNCCLLPPLIEEAQTLANRMEASLEEKDDLKRLTDDRKKMDARVNELYEEQTRSETKLEGIKAEISDCCETKEGIEKDIERLRKKMEEKTKQFVTLIEKIDRQPSAQ